jgi:hypothetical protein
MPWYKVCMCVRVFVCDRGEQKENWKVLLVVVVVVGVGRSCLQQSSVTYQEQTGPLLPRCDWSKHEYRIFNHKSSFPIINQFKQ